MAETIPVIVTDSPDRVIDAEELADQLGIGLCETSDTITLNDLIDAATEKVEIDTGQRSGLQRTYRWELPCFPPAGGEIILPWTPLIEVTSLKYIDVDEAEQALDENTDFRVQLNDDIPGSICLLKNDPTGLWPATFDQDAAVTIEYKAGKANARFKTAVRFLVRHWYEHDMAVSENKLTIVPEAYRALARSLHTGVYHGF